MFRTYIKLVFKVLGLRALASTTAHLTAKRRLAAIAVGIYSRSDDDEGALDQFHSMNLIEKINISDQASGRCTGVSRSNRSFL